MSGEELPVPDEVLTSARDQLDEEEIPLADNEGILHALSELTPVYENDRSYLFLGNYDREPIRRLNLVVDRLNRRQDAYAFRLVDIRGERDNSIQKVCPVADIVTYLVGVAEREPSDLLVEQGLLVGTTEYFAKSHVPQAGVRGRRVPLRLDAGRRLRTVRPGWAAVSLADRSGAGRRDGRPPVTRVGKSPSALPNEGDEWSDLFG